jgi:poly(A) polymerase
MPVITPAYPCMNSCFNVSHATLRIITEQLEIGRVVSQEIAESGGAQGWEALFQPFHFFRAYKSYLQVDVKVAGGESDLREWKGWVESRLRQLVTRVEMATAGMLLCHPNPQSYAAKPSPSDLHCTSTFFVGLSKPKQQQEQPQVQFDLRATTEEFKQEVYMYEFWRPGMELEVKHTRRKDLPSYVLDHIIPAGHLKRKRPQDNPSPSSSASGDSESSSSSRDGKRMATAGRTGSSPETESNRQSCPSPSGSGHGDV